MKQQPYGIYWLPPVHATNHPDSPENWEVWSAPYSSHIVGVVGRQSWESIEPKESTFNWTYLDSVLGLAAQGGFSAEICISTGGSPLHWPQWIESSGAVIVTLHSPKGEAIPVPAPWDLTFQAKLQELIRAIGARYDSNQSLGLVQMQGVGRQGELFFAENGNDYQELIGQFGALWPAQWEYAARAISGIYTAAFPTTCVTYSTGRPFPKNVDPNNAGMAALMAWCGETYNLGAQMVFAARDSGYYVNAKAPSWCNVFQGYQQDLPVGNGAAAQALQCYRSPYDGIWLEVYKGDCLDSQNFSAFDTFNENTSQMVA